MTTKIYAYKQGSESAKALAEGLGVLRIKHQGSKFKPAPKHTIINWGCSKLPDELLVCNIINSPEAVYKAANKLFAFEAMAEAGVVIPDFTTDVQDVVDWGNSDIVCRHKLTGHSGEGIEIVKAKDDLPKAPLYVRYIKKSQEYRVHVAFGEVVDVQRKARNLDVPDDKINWQVRNHKNGFIFAREGLVLPENATQQAVLAVHSLGLHFGAVDLIWNERDNKYYVLEVNTAPGLTGTTLDNYVAVFKRWLI